MIVRKTEARPTSDRLGVKEECPAESNAQGTVQKFEALSSLAVALSHAQELDPLLAEVLKTVKRLFRTDIVHIMLVDKASGNLRVCAAVGASSEYLDAIDYLKPGEGIAGRVLASGQPLVLQDASTDPRVTRDVVRKMNVHALACVPLFAAGQPIGVLVTAAVKPDVQITDDLALLEVIGQILGMAIENARLFEENLQARKLWESTFNAISDGISVHTQEMRIVKANRALSRILQIPVDELRGTSCCLAMLDRENPLPDCAALRATGDQTCQVTEVVERPNGQVLRVTVDPLLNEQGQVYGSVHVVSDMTEQVRLERRMARAEQLALIGELAAGLAHEVKNPLAGIKGALEIVLEGLSETDPHRRVLEHVVDETMRVNRIISDLLDYARPRPSSHTRIDLNALTERVIATTRLQLANSQIKIEFQPATKLPSVVIDPDELQKVILNLILNAIHAVKDHGCIVTSTAYDPRGKTVKLSVSDTGIGIPPENVDKIFRPFFTTKKRGTGLGLATCKRIVHSYGGTLTVDSEPGKGSTFTVTLPLLNKAS